MSRLEQSIMAREGLARGKPGREHTITEAEQGHYTYGFFPQPVLTNDSVVACETHDAFEGKIKSVADRPSETLTFPDLDPRNGPIYVNDAAKGDCLAVHIKSIMPRRPQPVGATCLIPEFGDFVGTIRSSPGIEAISSLVPDYDGGNMDLPDVAPGTVTYLPVNAPGALPYLGDCHAIQGDGELCGVALEHPTTTTVQVDLTKGRTPAWPRPKTSVFYMTIGSARSREDASRIADRGLIRWKAAEVGFDQMDAYPLLTMCGKVRLGNMVDPKSTLAASVARSIVAAHRS